MRYVKIFILAAAMMAAMACIKENVLENKPEENADLVEMTFTATSDESQTKAAFDEEAYPAIVWEGNESIAVLAAKTDQEFTTTSTGKVAEFTGLAEITDDQFYAVYPYDEGIALDGEVLTNVKIPSVQTVTEGSFDPKAFVAVAKSDDKQNFTFKAVGGFLKFQVGDEDVKSVTVVANAYTENEEQKAAPTIAGTAGISWSNDNPAHGLSNWTSDTSSSIKLVEDAEGDQFAAGKNYFITMRANSCPGGITVYVEYDNGEVYSISSTKQLFTAGVQNMIKNLGTFTKAKMEKTDDLYALYNLGYDLQVGSKTYNKSSHTFELFTATKANDAAIRTKVHTKDGKFYLFVDSGEYNFELGSYATIQSEVVVIGRYPNNPAKVSYTQISRINSGSLAMKNLIITPCTGKQTIENTQSTGEVSHLIFDNCKISGLDNSFVYVGINNKINDIQFKDCDVNISGDNAVLVKSYVGNTYPSITYSNNMIYNSGALNGNFKLFCDNKTKSSTVNTVFIDGNTFVNTYANTTYLIYTNSCETITITDNLIYYPTAITNGTGYLRTISSVYPEVAYRTITTNIAFCTDVNKAIRYLFDNTILGVNNTNTITDGTNPFSTYDLTNGVFVQSSTYASYGATR